MCTQKRQTRIVTPDPQPSAGALALCPSLTAAELARSSGTSFIWVDRPEQLRTNSGQNAHTSCWPASPSPDLRAGSHPLSACKENPEIPEDSKREHGDQQKALAPGPSLAFSDQDRSPQGPTALWEKRGHLQGQREPYDYRAVKPRRTEATLLRSSPGAVWWTFKTLCRDSTPRAGDLTDTSTLGGRGGCGGQSWG